MSKHVLGLNNFYVKEIYEKWMVNSSSVDKSWQLFFSENKTLIHSKYEQRENIQSSVKKDYNIQSLYEGIVSLVMAYRNYGHFKAELNPLDRGSSKTRTFSDLQLENHGLREEDLELYFEHPSLPISGTLREIIQKLEEKYCQHVAYEYLYVPYIERRLWWQQKIEQEQFSLKAEQKRNIYKKLAEAEQFEQFLSKKYRGVKRFGLEGCESLIPLLDTIISYSTKNKVSRILMCMAHRGRLNVLKNIFEKPFSAICSEFNGEPFYPITEPGNGDVKYHLGASKYKTVNGKQVYLQLMFNPSHLEFINPITEGYSRALQDSIGDENREQIIPIQIHGDAAMMGQGVVAETLNFSDIDGYNTGGTIHIITNNQIGFTANPYESRSTPYASDVTKINKTVVIHVNADYPEEVIKAAMLAVEYRQKFKASIVIDLIGYRRHGHNEGDEPLFTQPKLYHQIANHPTACEKYKNELMKEGILTEYQNSLILKEINDVLQEGYDNPQNNISGDLIRLEGKWAKLKFLRGNEEEQVTKTATSEVNLQKVCSAISSIPAGFKVHNTIKRIFERRENMLFKNKKIDWSLAEQLAYGTLMLEGYGVRLSGQDSKRGTFSHRHSSIKDVETEEDYIPLNSIEGRQGIFEVYNSCLSESGILGFEYGYSLAMADTLTIWEAQFGDFANGAQVMIDQFITSAESKWFRLSGLCLYLPHGLEGQGPEHSSARVERFLQLGAENNIYVVNVTTPSNLFHVVRRQMLSETRKPLVLFTGKSTLRHPKVISSLDETLEGEFCRVIDDNLEDKTQVKRVLLCSGKVYYDLLEKRETNKRKDIAIIRLEQMYPWPKKTLSKILEQYKNAELVWTQEEHANQGAWTYVLPRLILLCKELEYFGGIPAYAGRQEAATPSTGFLKFHKKEVEQLLNDAFNKDWSDLIYLFN